MAETNCPKVKILLSAYNGEKYIKEQVDSVLAQTYPDIELYIRDDGSKDGTLAVLQAYADDPRVHITQGENLGYIKSFFTLLKDCGEADYFAFCDQDDVWYEDKIERAVRSLDREEMSRPVLYCTDQDYCDADLAFLYRKTYRKPSFPGCIVECFSLGCCYVFNAAARNIVIAQIPARATAHDTWMYMVCQGLGSVIYDKRSSMKYRRHGATTSTAGKSKLELFLWRFKRFLVDDGVKIFRDQAEEYWELYANRLSEADRRTLALFMVRNPVTAVKKAFYPQRFRQNLTEELMLRCMFLIGRL